MTLKEKQLEFIIYCIENTAERLGRYSADVYNKLKELGAIDGYKMCIRDRNQSLFAML